MTPTLADHYRAVAEVTHDLASERDAERADHAETRALATNLGLDNRALKDRLAERDATIARLQRDLAETLRLVDRLRGPAATVTPLGGDRPHLGPPVRCNCGVSHSHGQAVALNAGARDPIEARP